MTSEPTPGDRDSASVLLVAKAVREVVSGSSDSLHGYDFERSLAYLRFRLNTWTPALEGDLGKYDRAVCGVVYEVCREGEAFLRGIHDRRCPNRHELPHATAVVAARDGLVDILHAPDHPATTPPLGCAIVTLHENDPLPRCHAPDRHPSWCVPPPKPTRVWELCAGEYAGRWVTVFGATLSKTYHLGLLRPPGLMLAEHDGSLGPLLQRALWMMGLDKEPPP